MYLIGDSLKAQFKKFYPLGSKLLWVKVTRVRFGIEESLVGTAQETLSSGF